MLLPSFGKVLAGKFGKERLIGQDRDGSAHGAYLA